ncbi:sigma-70 family RNA polymerase sigma factor [Persicitalea jodogahamensis]|uniref:DNA-directed RNA polymerase sigma-70 factor n=1 Tax=Persicitalea jodogahamensis TaxID=402147 RepID=A0A8J3D7P3_9BACT|nr:sigma-70 family RNA polymerase sigma factor [Persicitalea jodogahamensis]GHB86460.1 DNA-directed RNA polymerase sigma-70 factor [Persicitalea jodogahamensis]
MRDHNPADEELVKLLKNDDAVAFGLIYRRYWRQLFTFVMRQLDSKEDAEEIVHDQMLSLWQNRANSNIRNLKVYLFVGTRNLVNKSIRERINIRKYREYQLLMGVGEHLDASDPPDANKLAEAIENVLKDMPEKTARIFRMSKMEEIPVKSIASKMELSEKAVEYHITKSMKLLRHQLKTFHSDN